MCVVTLVKRMNIRLADCFGAAISSSWPRGFRFFGGFRKKPAQDMAKIRENADKMAKMREHADKFKGKFPDLSKLGKAQADKFKGMLFS